MSDKIKILFYGDSPTCNTGFGTVSKNILKRLQATGKYDITVVGINYFGDPHNLPYKIYPAINNVNNDVYGRQLLLDMLKGKDNFDVLFTLQDTFIVATIGEHIKKIRDGFFEERKGKKTLVKGKNFKWIFYFPIDASPKKEWLDKSVKLVDVAIPYTKYAEKECKKLIDREYSVIYHGYDKEDFNIISEEEKDKFRKEYFETYQLNEKFLIINVNRNQERKGLLQTMIAFKLFNQIVPNSVLYTHCDVANDRGGNLIELAVSLGIKNNWIYPNPDAYKNNFLFPVEYINKIYNIADVNMSTTLGEGFGLSIVEAMATKTINIFPNNTAITELLEDNRGILVDSGKTPNCLTFNGHQDNNLLRPTIDIMDMVKKLLWIYQKSDDKKTIEENAYEFANKNLNWDDIGKEFDKIIQKSIK